MQITTIFENLEEMMNFCKKMAGEPSRAVMTPAEATAPNQMAPGSAAEPLPTTQSVPAPPSMPPQPVATAKTNYQQDDLARAAMTLMDAGRQGDLLALLREFGVDALPSLQKDQYGAFATRLRGLGAQI